MEPHIVFRRASGAATAWLNRAVKETGANTVGLADDSDEAMLGLVASVDEDTQDVGVCVAGPWRYKVGEDGITAPASFLGADAAAKAVGAAAGEFYIARCLSRATVAEDGTVEVIVQSGQLAQSAT